MRIVRVLSLRGDIDIYQEASIEAAFARVGRSDTPTFTIVDLTDVRYLDTTFLNALIRARNRMAESEPESTICLVAPREKMVWRLFEITKLDGGFALYETMAAARLSVATPPARRTLALPA